MSDTLPLHKRHRVDTNCFKDCDWCGQTWPCSTIRAYDIAREFDSLATHIEENYEDESEVPLRIDALLEIVENALYLEEKLQEQESKE